MRHTASRSVRSGAYSRRFMEPSLARRRCANTHASSRSPSNQQRIGSLHSGCTACSLDKPCTVRATIYPFARALFTLPSHFYGFTTGLVQSFAMVLIVLPLFSNSTLLGSSLFFVNPHRRTSFDESSRDF